VAVQDELVEEGIPIVFFLEAARDVLQLRQAGFDVLSKVRGLITMVVVGGVGLRKRVGQGACGAESGAGVGL